MRSLPLDDDHTGNFKIDKKTFFQYHTMIPFPDFDLRHHDPDTLEVFQIFVLKSYFSVGSLKFSGLL